MSFLWLIKRLISLRKHLQSEDFYQPAVWSSERLGVSLRLEQTTLCSRALSEVGRCQEEVENRRKSRGTGTRPSPGDRSSRSRPNITHPFHNACTQKISVPQLKLRAVWTPRLHQMNLLFGRHETCKGQTFGHQLLKNYTCQKYFSTTWKHFFFIPEKFSLLWNSKASLEHSSNQVSPEKTLSIR